MWYILERDDETKIVFSLGNNPLHKNNTWGLFTDQGFETMEDAENFWIEYLASE